MIKNAVYPGASRRAKMKVPVELVGIMYFLLLVGCGVLLVSQPARIAQVDASVRSLERSLHDIKLKNEDLKKKVAQVEALSFVEKEAKGRLGMVEPSVIRTVALPESPEIPNESVASAGKDSGTEGILSLYRRIIAGVFKGGEVKAKEPGLR